MNWIKTNNDYISISDVESFSISEGGDLVHIRTRSGNAFEITGKDNVSQFMIDLGIDANRTTQGKIEKAILNR